MVTSDTEARWEMHDVRIKQIQTLMAAGVPARFMKSPILN